MDTLIFYAIGGATFLFSVAVRQKLLATYATYRRVPNQVGLAGAEVARAMLDRNQLQGKCGRCRYKFTCGGCRAMAYYEHGDLMAEDPTCFFEPEDETTVSEHEAQTNRMFKHYAFMLRTADRVREGGGSSES